MNRILKYAALTLPLSALTAPAIAAVAAAPVVAAAVAVTAAAAEDNPQVVVKTAVDNLTARISKDKKALKKSPEQLNALIEQSILPYVDLNAIARGVMGQFFRQATPAQFERFTVVFKQSMIRTYANGLTAYDDQKVVFKPSEGAAGNKYTPVNVEVTLDSGTVIPATFQMKRDAQGAWKVNNLIVNGLNLGLTFRKRFAEVVEQSGGNLDKAISAWSPGALDVIKDKKS